MTYNNDDTNDYSKMSMMEEQIARAYQEGRTSALSTIGHLVEVMAAANEWHKSKKGSPDRVRKAEKVLTQAVLGAGPTTGCVACGELVDWCSCG